MADRMSYRPLNRSQNRSSYLLMIGWNESSGRSAAGLGPASLAIGHHTLLCGCPCQLAWPPESLGGERSCKTVFEAHSGEFRSLVSCSVSNSTALVKLLSFKIETFLSANPNSSLAIVSNHDPLFALLARSLDGQKWHGLYQNFFSSQVTSFLLKQNVLYNLSIHSVNRVNKVHVVHKVHRVHVVHKIHVDAVDLVNSMNFVNFVNLVNYVNLVNFVNLVNYVDAVDLVHSVNFVNLVNRVSIVNYCGPR